MDDIVKAALKKWPNVPHCHGWLALDARGDWYLRDADTQALLDAALDEVAEQDAKAEAVHRAYVASGSGDVHAFAEMYGMNAHTVMRQLHRAGQLQAARTA